MRYRSYPRKIRRVLSVALLILSFLLFLDIANTINRYTEWIANIQLVHAVLAFSVSIIVAWLAITLLIGRIYCSTVCPLGTIQDFFAWLGHRKNRQAYHYAMPMNTLRYAVLFGFIVCICFGLLSIAYVIEPWSVFGKIAAVLLSPLNDTAVTMITSGLWGTITAILSLIIVAYISYRRGRLLCNTVCPVGSALSFPARISILKIEIDTDLCTGCAACAFACKSECIDISAHTVDSSRCVVCFDCTDVCPTKAIRLTASRKRLSTPLMQPTPKFAAGSA